MGSNQRLVGGAVYISSCQHTGSRVFQIALRGLRGGGGLFIVETWTGVILTIGELTIGGKSTFESTEGGFFYWGVFWKEDCCVDCPKTVTQCMPLNALVVWSLINFKWASGGHLHHNMTSVFVPTWSRVEQLRIGHVNDPPIIWPMWKGPSQLFVPNYYVPLLGSRNMTTSYVNMWMWNGLNCTCI